MVALIRDKVPQPHARKFYSAIKIAMTGYVIQAQDGGAETSNTLRQTLSSPGVHSKIELNLRSTEWT